MVQSMGETLQYELRQNFTTELRGFPIHYTSKPGLNRWDQITPSASLIAKYVDLSVNDRLFYFGCGHGACAAALARSATNGEIILTDINIVAFEMSRYTLEMNNIQNAIIFKDINIPNSQRGLSDRAVIDLPKGRKLAQRWLLQAWEVVRSGGYLYISGSNEEGIQSVFNDGQALWGPYTILGYKKGNRIARFRKNDRDSTLPAWAIQPGVQPGSWYEMDCSILDHHLHLCSLPGIFSYDRLDKGTRILLENIKFPNQACVLDLGCGYGIIGLIAALSGVEKVDLIDSNILAIRAAEENIREYNQQNADVIPSDALKSVKDRHYSLIITNPPFHSGKKVDYQMAQAFIRQSWQQLEPAGQFILVTNQFIRYDEIMRSLFRQVKQLVRTEGFQVWMGIK